MSEEMVERVAKAIYVSLCQRDGPAPQTIAPWEATNEYTKEWHRMTARAAIEAMREPTEAMIDAGDECGDWGPGINCDEQDAGPRNCWQAMIQAARQG